MAKGQGESRRDALIRENARLQTIIDGMRSTRRYTAGAAIAKEAVKYGFPSFFAWLSISELAGKVTKFDAAVDVCTSITEALKELVPSWIVQIVTITLLLMMTVVLRRTRTRNQNLITRVAELTEAQELQHDPKRTSSNLGRDGNTNEGDGL